MKVFWDNFPWMLLNFWLALVAVGLGWGWLRAREKWVKLGLFGSWFLFLPNTLYLISDIQYLPEQAVGQNALVVGLLLVQYAVLVGLGFLTFLVGLYPLQLYLGKRLPKKDHSAIWIILLMLNVLVGFAIVLGKIERTNSWYVFTHPHQVVNDSLVLVSSPDQVWAVVGFAVLANLVYFTFRKYLRFLD